MGVGYLKICDWKIADRVNKLLAEDGITGAELSRRINCSKTAVYRVIDGEMLPNTPMLIRMAKYFNVTTDYILFGKVDK